MFDDPVQVQMAFAYDALESAREAVASATQALLRGLAAGRTVPDLAEVAGGLHDLGARLDELDAALSEGAAAWALDEVTRSSALRGLLRTTEDGRAMTVDAGDLGARIPVA